jgi:hypothetical protein
MYAYMPIGRTWGGRKGISNVIKMLHSMPTDMLNPYEAWLINY